MSISKYKINPVRATCMKYDCTDHGIQGINDTCFGICAAYSGTYDTFAMDPVCTQTCTDLVEKRKKEIFGVGSCDHQVPYRPVAWEQVPRYVPQMLRKGYSPLEAKNTCIDLCKTTSLVEECQEKCILDFNAIEPYQAPLKNPIIKTSSFSSSSSSSSPSLSKSSSSHLYIILFLVLVLLLGGGYFLLSKIG